MQPQLDPTVVKLALRAVKTVAMADDAVDTRERALLEAMAGALVASGVDASYVSFDALTPIEPEELAHAVGDEVARTRILQAQFVMAIIDGDVTAVELEVLERFAAALGIDEPRMKNMHQLVSHHHWLLKLDLNRHSSMISDAMRHAYKKRGLRGVWQTAAPFLGKSFAVNEELAWRYRQLGLLPEGTFGREYWKHMCQRRYGFPGEPGGFPEELIKHDLCHVLGGFGTDPSGECQVVAFICGFMKTDPFWYLFMILVHMHLGIETFHKNPTGTLAFDPDQVVAAYLRGRGAVTDLYATGFDWWPLFEQPLEKVRAELGLV